MSIHQRDIRGVLIAVTGGRLLLPNASVAEVITYSVPESVPGAPDWLLGRTPWRGWRLPLVSFTTLADWGRERGEQGAKVAIIKLLARNPRLPYVAVVSHGFPRLVTVSADALVPVEGGDAPGGAVHSRVLLNEEAAAIPDLDMIERLLEQTLYAAA
ncbi:chemotaxis protein CheW [Coralloluteibacterium stylophorae]|uniref:Chemotaxis protein CheW n=1 Tax=Coralloluteibacterium stylophorae TaxID=1776034 RepID=A0A8J8AYN5_9GAMM|nr:chemotaxis protein CheW [Coralloluteibacterium stylophorae]MBS7456093.1 chemotaxis protein CheW [Coralloluteibacterium stylophorae]